MLWDWECSALLVCVCCLASPWTCLGLVGFWLWPACGLAVFAFCTFTLLDFIGPGFLSAINSPFKKIKQIKETLFTYTLGFNVTQLQAFHIQTQIKSLNELWHARLGHPRLSMFQRIIKDTRDLPSNVFPSSLKKFCISCSQRKLITRPFPSKTINKILDFLERLQTQVCGLVYPPNGTFWFFLVIIDALSKWSQVSLLSMYTLVFFLVRFYHIIILKLQA